MPYISMKKQIVLLKMENLRVDIGIRPLNHTVHGGLQMAITEGILETSKQTRMEKAQLPSKQASGV